MWLLLAMVGGHVAGVLLESLAAAISTRARDDHGLDSAAGRYCRSRARSHRPSCDRPRLPCRLRRQRRPGHRLAVTAAAARHPSDAGGSGLGRGMRRLPSALPSQPPATRLLGGADERSRRSFRRGRQPARGQGAADRSIPQLLRCGSLGRRGGAPLRRRLGCRTVADHGDAILGSQARGAAARAVQRTRGTSPRPTARPATRTPRAAVSTTRPSACRNRLLREPAHETIPAGAGRRLPCAGRRGGRGRSGP